MQTNKESGNKNSVDNNESESINRNYSFHIHSEDKHYSNE